MMFGKKKPTDSKIGALSLSDVRKKFSGSGVATEISVQPDNLLWLPSRVPAINHLLGGGVPYGRIIEIFGEESSGKTLLALDFAAVTTSLGGVVLWNDAEQTFDQGWAELNGVDPSRIELYNETGIELISDWWASIAMAYRSQLTNNEPILFVCDSLAAIDTLDNINSTQTSAKAEMGNRAKAIYKMLRIRNNLMSQLGVVSIFINQLRHKVNAGQFQDPDTTPGGNAMKFYASIRLGLYGSKAIKLRGDKGPIIGRLASVRVKKNKVAPPRETLKGMRIFHNADYHDPGFDRFSNLSTVLLARETITSAGGRYKDSDGNQLAYGEEKFEKLLQTDDKLRRRLLLEAGINTVSQLRAKLENESDNLFPVPETKKTRKKSNSDDDQDEEESADD